MDYARFFFEHPRCKVAGSRDRRVIFTFHDLKRSSRNGTKSRRDVVTREERCSFPVGTDRPARRRPAALDRPVTPGPLLPGRLLPTVYSPNTDSNSVYRMYTSSRIYCDCDSSAAAFFIANSRGPCASQDHPAPRAKHAPLHHPPGAHVGTTLPAAACAAAAALRAARASRDSELGFAPRHPSHESESESFAPCQPSAALRVRPGCVPACSARPSRIRDVVPTQNSLFSSMVAVGYPVIENHFSLIPD